MQRKPKLREMIDKARSGDQEALIQVVQRLTPLIKKYSRRLGYHDAYPDLVFWILAAVKRYKPKTTWGKDELERYFSGKHKDTR
ncbi:MAG: helix-turn-helix domain-containing protein [Bacillota bacterium]